jgi:multidrug efflux pump subunit AcrA (membrane-fusion protein)
VISCSTSSDARPSASVLIVTCISGKFKSVEVEVLKTIGDYTAIKGLKVGTRVVVKGAFFLQSALDLFLAPFTLS